MAERKSQKTQNQHLKQSGFFRLGQIYFLIRDIPGAQERDAQNQSACPIEKQLEKMVFVFYYLNRTCEFHF